jgi:hypothetical protein
VPPKARTSGAACAVLLVVAISSCLRNDDPWPLDPASQPALVVNVSILGLTSAPDILTVLIGDARVVRMGTRTGPRSARFAEFTPGTYRVSFEGLPINCWQVDDDVVEVSSGTARIDVGLACVDYREAPPGTPLSPLGGIWRVVQQTYRDSAGVLLDERGEEVYQLLVVRVEGEQDVRWSWMNRNYHQGWPVEYGTIELASADAIRLTHSGQYRRAMEDWGACGVADCEGPLHGVRRFSFEGDRLILQSIDPVPYGLQFADGRYWWAQAHSRIELRRFR